MIKITKIKDKECPIYFRIEDTKDKGNQPWALYPKELEQLYKKIGKIVGKGKGYCPHCKAGLK
jgi:hypothetical protein